MLINDLYFAIIGLHKAWNKIIPFNHMVRIWSISWRIYRNITILQSAQNFAMNFLTKQINLYRLEVETGCLLMEISNILPCQGV